MAARAAIAITQLDTTLTGIEACRATSHDAGKNIDTHGSAFSRSSRDPDTETTAPAQTPTLMENATAAHGGSPRTRDRKSTRLNSSHANISYAVFCLKT